MPARPERGVSSSAATMRCSGPGRARRSSVCAGSMEWIRGNVDRWTAAPADAPEAVQDAIAPPSCSASRSCPELAALPESLARERVLYCHASPLSDVRGFSPQAADDDLELLAGADAPRVVFGHTHLAFRRPGPGGVDLVNPGSVGLPAGRGSARRVRRRARRRRA